MSKIGIDNLVESGVTVITVGRDVKETLKDGFQLFTDVPYVIFKDGTRIKKIYDVREQLKAEILDLTPDEIDDFSERVADEAGVPNDGNVVDMVLDGIKLIGRAGRVVYEVIDIYEDARAMFRHEE
jgi:hypothetical protein